MNIIPQMKLFEESDFENLGDLERLERLQMVRGALDKSTATAAVTAEVMILCFQ